MADCPDITAASLDRVLQCSNLHTLSVSHCALNSSGAKSLAALMTQMAHLTSLDASRNDLGVDAGEDMDRSGLVALFSALETNSTLTKLDLARNDMGGCGEEAAMEKLAAALGANTALRTLSLAKNDIDEEDAKILAPGIAANGAAGSGGKLEELDLSGNVLKVAGCKLVAFLALRQNATLSSLSLARNDLYWKKDAAAIKTLAAVMKTNTALTSLDVSKNWVMQAGTLKGLVDACAGRPAERGGPVVLQVAPQDAEDSDDEGGGGGGFGGEDDQDITEEEMEKQVEGCKQQ
jgi:Ran GTPase-activating protein (RanGAP) involved in mRNA processing and transport